MTFSYRAYFPDRQSIINYIIAHPVKTCLDMDAVSARVPNSIEKIGDYFANKEMPDREIAANVRYALADHADQKKLTDFGSALKQLAGSMDEVRNGGISSFTDRMRLLGSQAVQPDPFFEVVVQMYSVVLNHLIDGETFDSASDGNSKWTREVIVFPNREIQFPQ